MSSWRLCSGSLIVFVAVSTAACGGGDDGQSRARAPEARCPAQGRVAYPNPAPLGGVFAIADIDEDGLADLITSVSGNLIARHSGLGNGSFCEGEIVGTGSNPSQAVVADIDADGATDLVTTDGRDVFVLFNSSGQLSDPVRTLLGLAPSDTIRDVEIADLNRDGFPDLVTENGTGEPSILVGNGDGSFEVESIKLVADQARELAVGDLDGDGVADLVVRGSFPAANETVWYSLLATGEGDFSSEQPIDFPDAHAPQLADLNGDGNLDLVAVDLGDVNFALGLGNGGFGSTQTIQVVLRDSQFPPALAVILVADLNRDGQRDLVTLERTVFNSGGEGGPEGTARVHLSRGDGTFVVGQVFDVREPMALAADLNNDDSVDLVIPGAPLSVWLGSSSGTFSPRRVIPRYNVGKGPTSVLLADLNQDAALDIATANSESGSLSLLMGRGDGTFRDAEFLALAPDAAPADVAVADFNADGIPDLVTADRGTSSVTVLLGRGAGEYEAGRVFEVGNAPTRVLVSDLDADGNADILTTNVRDCVATDFFFETSVDGLTIDIPDCSDQEVVHSISILFGIGMGSFEAMDTIPSDSSPVDIAVSDFDRDGFSDLAVLSAGSSGCGSPPSLVLLLGNGSGSFATPSVIPLGSGINAAALAIADLDQDGDADLVTANVGTAPGGLSPFGDCFVESGLSILLGADASFKLADEVELGRIRPVDMVVGLLDGDDIPDIATVDREGELSIRLGIGDGSFAAEQRFATDASPTSIAVGDLNGDAVPDVVTANLDSNDVSVLLGVGQRSETDPQDASAETT